MVFDSGFPSSPSSVLRPVQWVDESKKGTRQKKVISPTDWCGSVFKTLDNMSSNILVVELNKAYN